MFENFRASILKLCSDFAAANDMTVTDFESRATMEELPEEEDCIGIWGFAISVDQGLLEIDAVIAFATTPDDTNSFRLNKRVSDFFDMLKVGKSFPVLDADTGAVLGSFVIRNGVGVLRAEKTQTRAVRGVVLTAGSDVTH